MPKELPVPADAEIEEARITVPAASPKIWTPMACDDCAPQIVLVSTDAPGEVSRNTAALVLLTAPPVAASIRPPIAIPGVPVQSVLQCPLVPSMAPAQLSRIVGVEFAE